MLQQGDGTSHQSLLMRLRLMHGAQMSTLLLFSIIAFLARPVGNVDESLSEIFMYAMALLFAVSLTAAHFAFKKILHKAGSLSDIKSKMTRYTTACIVRSALFEVPGLFAAVIVLVTGNILALAGSLVALLLLLFFRPSRQQVVQDLNLTIQEMLMLESPKKNR